MDAALIVVEGDQAVAEHERGVGQRRAVHEPAAAVGLELVAEVAGEAAGEVERQIPRVGAQALELALAEVEDALPPLLPPARALDREHARGDVVEREEAERAIGSADVGEACEAGLHARAVEPHGVRPLPVERGERDLGVAPGLERAVADADSRGRPAARGAALAPGNAGAPRVRSRKLRTSVRPCSVEIDSGWNCTPHRGRVRCSSAITTSSGVHAVTRRAAGHRADHQRVVADCREALRNALEQAAPVVVDRAQPAVHHLRRMVDRAAGDVGERLVAEAHAEHRHLGALQHVERDADVAPALGAAGAGGDDDVVDRQRRQLLPRQLVVADDDRLVATGLAQQVEEVEGERVVVVDQERAHGRIYTLATLAQERLRLLPRETSRYLDAL